MAYFVTIAFLLLIGYYIWAIFFNKPAQTLQIDEIEEEEVVFLFDSPIKVSEQFIRPRANQPDEEKDISAQGSSSGLSKGEKAEYKVFEQPILQYAEAEKEVFEFNLPKALETGRKILSFLYDERPKQSSVHSAELEYLSLFPIDLARSTQEGRSMFAHIPVL